MSEIRKLVHVEKVPMRWADMDVLRHINNANYFRFMEQARVSFFESIGFPLIGDGGPVVVTATCNFKRALVYPGTVEVSMYLGTPGRSSIKSWYELRVDSDPDTIYADGESVIVWLDAETNRSAPFPDEIRRRL